MCKLNPITFHGDTIFCIDYCGEPYTPMKPIIENMGLGWASQTQKLNANKERWGVTIIVTPTDGGEQETLCMPVRKLPAYLNTINPKKVKIAIRDRVILYQNESDNALWDYWTKGRAERKQHLDPEPHNQPQPTQPALPPLDAPITPDQQCTLQSLVKARVDAIPQEERTNAIYPQIWGRFKNHFRIAKYNQLPQTRLAEAIEYLAKLEIKKSKKQQPALAPDNTPANTAPQVESNTIPALPDNQYPDHAKDTLKLLEKIQKELHEVRVVSSVRSLPASQNLASRRDGERFAIEESLYQMVDGLLFSAWHAVNAGAKIRRWKA